ncbi:cellobiose-specific phosphotransferase system component IIA [Clostridium beijerinckii]|nr:PTS lactose/cellobiose transporter subunit IIA [Clostridium beijerinckii]NRZ59423.1 cellobiose-specific phosphotransferase system component IIA [Clostridium beijerinckii]
MIQAEINGKGIKITLLMVHAQDQLMTAMSENVLIEKMVRMYKIMNEK